MTKETIIIGNNISKQNMNQLKKLLKYLSDRNTFFQKEISNNKLISDEVVYELFKNFKLIDRRIIKDNYQEYISLVEDEKILEITTGTSGIILECPKTKHERMIAEKQLWKSRRMIDCSVSPENLLLLESDLYLCFQEDKLIKEFQNIVFKKIDG